MTIFIFGFNNIFFAVLVTVMGSGTVLLGFNDLMIDSLIEGLL
jgi:hypothetical protein